VLQATLQGRSCSRWPDSRAWEIANGMHNPETAVA
jgi:hypothetical protein